jgi:polyhydroxyalkanoate synthesis regulator phasin
VRPTGRNYKPDLRDRLIKAGKLTNRHPTDRIETILKQVESGEIDFKPGSEAYRYLIPLVAPQSDRYQPAVRDRLIKAGKLNPRNATARITALLDKIENGTVSFQPNSKNYQYLATYFSPNSASYRPEVRARLIAAGKLSERKRNDIEALLIKVESGEDPFKTRSETYKILTSFFSPKGKSYRADVRERLIKAGKLKPASARLSIPELLIQIETGLIEFSPGTKAYRSLRPYFLPSGKKYDPDIRRRLISAGKLPTDQWPSNQKRSNTTHNNKN